MTAPNWPTCQAVTGCPGVRIEPGRTCLRHLPPQDRARALSDLGPGADVDVRGVEFDDELFRDLLAALKPESGPPKFGIARFDVARFALDVEFSETEFSADCSFSGAIFRGRATFTCTFAKDVWFGPSNTSQTAATFAGPTQFNSVRFKGEAHFGGIRGLGRVSTSRQAVPSQQARMRRSVTPGVEFRDTVSFGRCEFSKAASWQRAVFHQAAWFHQATFEASAQFAESTFDAAASFEATQFRTYGGFAGAVFKTDPNFAAATFDRADFADATFSAPGGSQLGPCTARELNLDSLRSHASLTVQCDGLTKITAVKPQCAAGTMNLQLDGTIKVDASAIRSATGLTLAYQDKSLTLIDAAFDTPATMSSTEYLRPRVLLLEKVDATNLTLAGMYLNACRFKDCHNRDKLRIEGPLGFSRTPTKGLWTNRRALAEEHEWRARYDRRPRGWFPEWTRHPDEDLPAPAKAGWKSNTAQEQAAQVQSIYRDLRKGREDAKDEPGAADFYFGEMEMRRMAAPRWSWERVLLTAYWAFSGYGLRASRALTALVLVLVLGTVGYATVGFAPSAQTVYQPVTSTQPITYRQVSAPGPKPGWAAAIDQSVDSTTALLRASTPRALTGTGRVIEVLLRLLGPLLLGLAVLALRSRVKR